MDDREELALALAEQELVESRYSELASIHEALRRRSLLKDLPPRFLPLLRPSRYKGLHGGRGGAKSHTFAEMLLARCVRFPGTRIVCVREVQKSLEQSVKRLLEDKIKALHLGDRFNILKTHIETPGDGIIIFQGMQNHTAETIKSLEGYDIAWVEEAQTLSDTSLTLLRPTIRKPGSELWFSWNPRHATDPVDKFFRGGEHPPSSVCLEVNFPDNPYFPEVLRQELEFDRRRDPDKYSHVWLGKYLKLSEARVFRNWRVEEFETPHGTTLYHGADWGFSVDPTALIRGFVPAPRKLYIDREAYGIGVEIDDTPTFFDGLVCGDACSARIGGDSLKFKEMPDFRKPESVCERPEHAAARKWKTLADSARPETISFMQRHGYAKLQPAKKGPGSVEEGIKFLQSYDIVIHPRCTHTIDEFTFYSWKVDPLTGEVLPVLADKKNHVIDASRYSVEDLRAASKKGGLLF